MTVLFSPWGNQQFSASGTALAVGHKLYTYAAGSSSPLATYTDSTGAVAQSNPIILNTLGMPTSGQIWLTSGLSYKLVWTDANDVVIKTEDNIYGITTAAAAVSQFVASGITPTYISANTFSLPGDQTTAFHVDRRIQTTNTGGTFEGTISSSVYGAVTTVTVVNDSGVLDSGLSAVSYSLLTATKSAVPGNIARAGAVIQPIDATVSANALTVTINPTHLDFRSATITSGAVNNRTVPIAVSCVVPNTATLGTVSGNSERLVLLAIDNAGTVEAAIVNLSGGVLLDESTLISTTALSTGSDSANVIYSTTARSNVSFRVVGFIDITEATAGVWATAPARIQGAGGLATAGWNSIGYGQTEQDVKASRAITTVYYNTTGKPITVYISIYSTVSASFTVTTGGVVIGVAQPGANLVALITFVVRHGGSYNIVSSGGTTTINNWVELR